MLKETRGPPAYRKFKTGAALFNDRQLFRINMYAPSAVTLLFPFFGTGSMRLKVDFAVERFK
jgi:hypothetical protein